MRWLAAALLGASLLYLPRLNVPLMWDDRGVIVLNPAIGEKIPAKAFFNKRYFEFSGEASWRPVATASYRLLASAAGKNPVTLRLFSLFLHGLACFLLFRLAQPWFGAETAAAGAALFALHPAHLETLQVVAFNEEPLCAVFLLGMLLCHRAGRTAPAAALLALALGSKETGLAGPILAVLFDRTKKTALLVYGIVCGLYLGLRFGPLLGPESPAPWLSFGERLALGGESFLTALRVFFAPAALRIEYFALPTPWGWLALAFGAALVAYWLLKTQDPWLLWPLPFLAAASPLLPVGLQATRLFAERWLYLPALGACMALAAKLGPRRSAALLMIWVPLAAYGARAWDSEPALWRNLAERYPWSAKAWEGLGDADLRAGNIREARFELQHALDLRDKREDPLLAFYVPRAGGALTWERSSLLRSLALADLSLNRTSQAEESFLRAMRIEPADTFSSRALAYLAAERGDWTTAKERIDSALKLAPDDELLLKLKADSKKKKLTFKARFS